MLEVHSTGVGGVVPLKNSKTSKTNQATGCPTKHDRRRLENSSRPSFSKIWPAFFVMSISPEILRISFRLLNKTKISEIRMKFFISPVILKAEKWKCQD